MNDIRDLTSSLKATFNPDSVGGSAEAVRVCKHCHGLLCRRLDQVDGVGGRPELLELYERLKVAMVDGESLVPKLVTYISITYTVIRKYSFCKGCPDSTMDAEMKEIFKK
jgi:hypothetical protein